ncbi:TetR family transcriptional regulator [Actinomadura sp. KC216]|uniref:TetR/AcrR family transcriptional regulator n=1 Tax=Actinomadura sp. KC216 TaxID=2530370 RepID=UPI0010435290|nr:TetR family transcriptional regulator [Actinomadura sp. KC216]TDB74885.1 TetR family transcriptional regulator [Actinomadura sp. KC216]
MPEESETAGRTRSRRDPAGRRRVIVEAAAELITEVGTDGLTHRLVAARAGVPLGSTTQYFATLADLREAAMQHLADEIDEGLAVVREAMRDMSTAPAALASAFHDYLRDVRLVQADSALTWASVHDPQLRSLSLRWFDELVAILSAHIGPARATAVAVFADGATWHAALHEEPLDLDVLTGALTALFTEPR